ncbi:MAG TPA: ATP-binding protein, partial [Acidobacteriota bacterium]|nr:ATP-binding protein [Acidobacteriota bacterium]
PVSNPPSKQPLLTLLKQARAFGLGIVLATQNPVDLDYKGLSNAGTWWIGRLQTDRDKERLLDGLQGAATSAAHFDRQKLGQILSGLSNRIFLMNNAHEDQPIVLETRWALSYLAGPLTRDQIKTLMDPVRKSATAPEAPAANTASQVAASKVSSERPVLPPTISQYFIASRNAPGAETVYRAMVYGCGKVFYADPKAGVAQEQAASLLADFADGPVNIDWQKATESDLVPSDLEKTPEPDISFAPLPDGASKPKNYDAWNKSLSDYLFRTQQLELLKSPSTGEISKPGESERDFRVRLVQDTRELRDQMVDRLRQKYAAKIASLQDRIRRAEGAQQREQAQATSAKVQTAISFGTTVLGAIFGRKTLSASTLGRATTAARGVGRSIQQSQDVTRAEENVTALNQQLADLENQMKSETDSMASATDPQTEALQSVQLKPKKTNITVTLVSLVWVPYAKDSSGKLTQAF